ncbi:MAG: hypothetical protein L6U16_09170 [Porphyromonadaceae bacterium]|nr:MAG: hypothetical protein L6U16_09170 [Porphyromonadaceae bacterium]
MEATTVANFKGGEGEYVVKTYLDEQNRIMQGLLPQVRRLVCTCTRKTVKPTTSSVAQAMW